MVKSIVLVLMVNEVYAVLPDVTSFVIDTFIEISDLIIISFIRFCVWFVPCRIMSWTNTCFYFLVNRRYVVYLPTCLHTYLHT